MDTRPGTNKRVVAFAFALMLLTGMVLGQLWGLSTPLPAAPPASNPMALRTAERFYAAINTLLKSGDPSSLRALLHPAFVEHTANEDRTRSARDLETSLIALGELFPGLTLRVTASFPGGDLVASELTATGQSQALVDEIAIHADLGASGFDLLRVAEGLIVERWVSNTLPDLPRIESLGSIGIDRSELGRPLHLERLVFQRSSSRTLSAHQGTIIIIESGSLEVRLSTYGQAHESTAVAIPDTGDTLEAGSVSLIPAYSPFTLQTSDRDTAAALQIRIGTQSPAGQPRLTADRQEIAPGVVREWLVQFSDIRSHAGPFVLSMQMVNLGAGNSIANHHVAEIEFMHVMGGSVEVAVASGEVGLVSQNGTLSRRSGLLTLAPTQRIVAGRGSEVSYRAAGASGVTALLVKIESADPDSN